MEVSYNTIRGSLNVTPDQNQPLNRGPRDPSSSCFLIFDGSDLTEDELKDWLRLCAQQVGSLEPVLIQSCRFQTFSLLLRLQTQEKKPQKTRNDLSPQEVEHTRVSMGVFSSSQLPCSSLA